MYLTDVDRRTVVESLEHTPLERFPKLVASMYRQRQVHTILVMKEILRKEASTLFEQLQFATGSEERPFTEMSDYGVNIMRMCSLNGFIQTRARGSSIICSQKLLPHTQSR